MKNNNTTTMTKIKSKTKNIPSMTKKIKTITTTALATTATTPHLPALEVCTYKDLLASKWDNLNPTLCYNGK